MTTVFLRTPFNYDRDEASDASSLRCADVSLARQEFREESDINTIVDRFGIGYDMPEGVRAPTFEDFADVFDFQSAMNVSLKAREAFMALPAAVRAEFGNDPQAFVAFASDDRNFDRLDALGMIKPEAKEIRLKQAQEARAKRDAELVEAARRVIAERDAAKTS